MEGKSCNRAGEKIGWLADNDIYDKSGKKLGYFERNDIYDASGKKVAWMEGNYVHMETGEKFSFDENRNVVCGGLLSNEQRAAARIFFGE